MDGCLFYLHVLMGKEIQSYIQRPPAAARNTGWQRGAFDDARLVLAAFDGLSQKLPGDASPPGQSVAEILRLIIKIYRLHTARMDIHFASKFMCLSLPLFVIDTAAVTRLSGTHRRRRK